MITLTGMYNAYKKENNIDFASMNTKYFEEYLKLQKQLLEIIPFNFTDTFKEFENIIRKDEQERFEEEKKLLLKIGMQIGLDTASRH